MRLKLRELIDQSGDVVKPPSFHIGGAKCDELTALIWMEYRESQVAQPYDPRDPYAREIGGES